MATTPSTQAQLFTPLKIRGIEFKNRIGVSPMCQYSSEDGFFNAWHKAHLGSRAIGGAGLVIAEATAVEPEGRISPEDTGLWKDEHIVPLKEIATFLKSQGAVAGIQLAHAGRKGSAASPWNGDHHLKEEEGGWQTKAPSAIAFGQNLWKVPKEMTVQDILDVEQKFVDASKRAVEAGFQVIELHAAHGYLIHQFLSPLANKRTDDYGGSFENRTRLLTEIVTKIRATIPESMLLFVRLNSTDWDPEGWTIEEAVKLSEILKTLGVDLIDCSSGFVIPNYSQIPFGPGYHVPFSNQIKHEAGILTAVVGGITTPKQAEEIIANQKADLVLLARESLRNPNFPYTAAKELGVDIKTVFPKQYWRV